MKTNNMTINQWPSSDKLFAHPQKWIRSCTALYLQDLSFLYKVTCLFDMMNRMLDVTVITKCMIVATVFNIIYCEN